MVIRGVIVHFCMIKVVKNPDTQKKTICFLSKCVMEKQWHARIQNNPGGKNPAGKHPISTVVELVVSLHSLFFYF